MEMESGIEKYATLIMKRGKKEIMKRIKVVN